MASHLKGFINRQRLRVVIFYYSVKNRISHIRLSKLLRSRTFLLATYVIVMIGLAGLWWWNSPYRLWGRPPLTLPNEPPTSGSKDTPAVTETEPVAAPDATEEGSSEKQGEAETPAPTEEPAQPALVLAVNVDKIRKPVEGPIIADYGFKWSKTYQDYRFHHGVGIGTTQGTPVAAAYAGRVLSIVEKDPEWGCLVTIDHGSGWRSVYASLTGVMVKAGQSVSEGQQIGQVAVNPPARSADGPQFYFALYKGEDSVDPTHMFK